MRLEFIPVGTVVNAHGVRGEIKVHPEGFDPAFVAGFGTVYLDGRPVEVLSARVHKNVALLTLPGVEDMDAALALKGRRVSVRRADAALPAGEYFDAELLGLTVLDDGTGAVLGTLERVLPYPAHKVYEVRGERTYLIPAVPDVFIAAVDIDGGTMRIHNMKGLAADED
ncbi:MAG: 16S rRNA processing protein RimM [Ruminococcaceae bacterium]|nr:16S rRNA processing protein RimM [Oscillospiraceae bacterium]